MTRPQSQRIYILEKSDAGLQFQLPAKKYFISIILQGILSFFMIWFSGFFGYYFLLSLIQFAKKLVTIFHTDLHLLYPNAASMVTIGLLFSFTSFAGYGFVRSLLWQIGGKEVVRTDGRNLILIYKIFHWEWCRNYSINDITHFREDYRAWATAARIPGFRSNPERDGVITFQVNGKIHRFAINVSRADAREIVAKIKNYSQKGETA